MALAAAGIVVLAIGAVLALTELRPSWYASIALWLIAALVIHDGVIAVGVLGVSILARRASRRIPFAVVLVIQGAAVIAAIVIALVVPEIIGQAFGTANSSVLPLDYVRNLLGFLAALVALAAATSAGIVIMGRFRERASTKAP